MSCHPRALHCVREVCAAETGRAGQPHLQGVLVGPQQEFVLPQREGDILQLRQIAAAAIHCPQIVVRGIRQPCYVLQPTQRLKVMLLYLPMCNPTAPHTSHNVSTSESCPNATAAYLHQPIMTPTCVCLIC